MKDQPTIELKRNKKSSNYIITKTDSEEFHHTLFVSKTELIMIAAAIHFELKKQVIELKSLSK